jgi:ubiquinone/menaquinone biosynthesis C-methylase UbiE
MAAHNPVDAAYLPATDAALAPVNDSIAPDIETASDQYALRFGGVVGAFLLRQQTAAAAALLDGLPVAAPLRVLDVGGGHTHLTTLFLARGHAVTVHGSALTCFSRVRELQRTHTERLGWVLGPLWRLPAGDREYDMVCSLRLLGHMSSWEQQLAEQCRVAKRYMLCEFAVPEGFQRLARPLHGVKVRAEPDTRPFTPIAIPEITGVLRTHGFRVVQVERQFVLPIMLHRKLASPSFSATIEALCRYLGLTAHVGSPVLLLAEREH